MAITIERQVPERGTRGVAAAPAGPCCCCCCCCLHTVGGVIGALSARAQPVDPQIPVSALGGRTLEPRYSATGLYWLCTLIVGSVMAGYFFAFEGISVEAGMVALWLAMGLPAVQLVASARRSGCATSGGSRCARSWGR